MRALWITASLCLTGTAVVAQPASQTVVADGSGRASEATFQLAGWSAIRDKIATACMWTSTAAKSPPRR